MSAICSEITLPKFTYNSSVLSKRLKSTVNKFISMALDLVNSTLTKYFLYDKPWNTENYIYTPPLHLVSKKHDYVKWRCIIPETQLDLKRLVSPNTWEYNKGAKLNRQGIQRYGIAGLYHWYLCYWAVREIRWHIHSSAHKKKTVTEEFAMYMLVEAEEGFCPFESVNWRMKRNWWWAKEIWW